MTIAAGLIVSRFVHYLALSILFGGALFPFYGFVPPLTDAKRVPPWLRNLLLGAAVLALLSGISWFVFTTAGMSGSLSGVIDPAVLTVMVRDTDFGRVWLLRLLLASILILLLLGRRVTARRHDIVVAGALVLLASIALTGHSGSDSSNAAIPHRIADGFHLVAAGVWVGALVVFARLVMVEVRHLRKDELAVLHHALARFSGVGTLVVVTLILSGLSNPGFLTTYQTTYGQILLVKLALFGSMLLLAAANRFWLTPRLSATRETASGLAAAVHALRLTLLIETAFALMVLAAVAWMGTLAPAA